MESQSVRFTSRTKRALGAASEAAERLGHEYIGTEHVLLGIMEVCEDLLAGLISPAALEEEVMHEAGRGAKRRRRRLGPLPYTSKAKRSLECAMSETRRERDVTVEPDHLVLGLVRERKGAAARILDRLGIASREDWAAFRACRAMGAGRFRIHIDDESDQSYYEQIVAQVKEAVATNRLAPGERLPSVRRLADLLDIAPGTVAKAYAELEQAGVVQTEGARGTRVASRRPRSQIAAERRETLVGLLRPAAVAAFHLGATAGELRDALERALHGVLEDGA